MKKKLLHSCFLLCLGIGRVSDAQEISTLFTTPEERAYLDFLRQEFLLNNQANNFDIDEVVPAVPIIEEVVVDAPAISSYALEGIFTRRDGSRTVWLNNSNFDENNLPANMMLVDINSQTMLRIQTESGLFDLKAGQTLDVVNGIVLESWQLDTPEPLTNQNNSNGNTAEPAQENTVEVLPQNPLVENETEDTEPEEIDVLAPPLEMDADTLPEEITSVIESGDSVAIAELFQTLQANEQIPDNGDVQ